MGCVPKLVAPEGVGFGLAHPEPIQRTRILINSVNQVEDKPLLSTALSEKYKIISN